MGRNRLQKLSLKFLIRKLNFDGRINNENVFAVMHFVHSV